MHSFFEKSGSVPVDLFLYCLLREVACAVPSDVGIDEGTLVGGTSVSTGGDTDLGTLEVTPGPTRKILGK